MAELRIVTETAASAAPPRDPRPPADYYDPADSDNVCLLCEQPSYSPLYEIDSYGFPVRFQRCSCGLVKQTPMPNERFFEWFFNAELFFSSKRSGQKIIWGFYDFFKDERCRLLTSRWRYWRMRRLFRSPEPLDVMKIGPATGTFLHVAQEHGHRAVGCDVSDQFIEYAQRQYGVEITRGRYERQGYPSESFDRILLFNVIENLPNPLELLAEVRRTLRPGGYFILNYVEMRRNLIAALQKERYFLYRPPITYIFTGSLLEAVLRKAGLEVVTSFRDVRFMHLEKILSLLKWRRALRVAQALRLHRIVFPIYAYPSRILVARRS